MKKNALIGFIAVIFIALIAVSNSYAASHTFKYTETFKDKIVPMPWGYYDVIGTGKITIIATILLNTSTIAWDKINGDTVLGISFEDFLFEQTLGDASTYGNGSFFDPNKRKARFVDSGAYYAWWTNDENDKYINYQIVDVSWSKTKLTIKLTCYTSPYEIQFPVIAYYYLGELSNISITNEQELVDAYISIGDFAVGFYDMNLTGSSKYKYAKKGKYDYFDTWNISVKAAGIGTVVE